MRTVAVLLAVIPLLTGCVVAPAGYYGHATVYSEPYGYYQAAPVYAYPPPTIIVPMGSTMWYSHSHWGGHGFR